MVKCNQVSMNFIFDFIISNIITFGFSLVFFVPFVLFCIQYWRMSKEQWNDIPKESVKVNWRYGTILAVGSLLFVFLLWLFGISFDELGHSVLLKKANICCGIVFYVVSVAYFVGAALVSTAVMDLHKQVIDAEGEDSKSVEVSVKKPQPEDMHSLEADKVTCPAKLEQDVAVQTSVVAVGRCASPVKSKSKKNRKRKK